VFAQKNDEHTRLESRLQSLHAMLQSLLGNHSPALHDEKMGTSGVSFLATE
jgi:hypothetical protein